MKRQHPSIKTYRELLKQEPNAAYLDFSLIQQMWLRVRGTPEQRASDYAMVLLRAMAFSFLLSQGYSELEIREQQIEVMEQFEREYRVLSESIVKGGEARMRRTRRSGNVVPLFTENNGGNRQ